MRPPSFDINKQQTRTLSSSDTKIQNTHRCTNRFIHINMKLIKRKDGSYSKRGLWDNIRANRGSGKEPTAAMLKQERKIKKAEKKRG